MLIERHKIDDDYLKDMNDRFERKFSGLSGFVDAAKTNSKNLFWLAGEALRALSYGCIIGAEISKLRRSLELAAGAYTALFVTAASPIEGTTVTFLGEKIAYASRPDESTVDVGSWIAGFYLNILTHNINDIDAISRVPGDLLKNTSTASGKYLTTYMEALRTFGLRRADGLVDLAITALKETDPKRPDIYDPDWTLFLHVPQLEVLIYLVTKNVKFGESLAKAVELHKKFWSKSKDRRRDYRGYISIELTALAAIGKEQGLPFDVESPYLPMFLTTV
jgi:Immunity protein 49